MMLTTRKVTKLTKNLLATSFLVASLVLSVSAAQAATAKEGDARIKTLVYNDNEVFRIMLRNGFQTDVELSQDETIDTLSIGDSIGWQITPASHRIFIKPLQRTGITNLSVITNKRTYQFELVATNPVANTPDHAYVVKFYYPEGQDAAPQIDRTRGSTRPISATAIPEFSTATPPPPAAPIMPAAMPGDTSPSVIAPVAPSQAMPSMMPVPPTTTPMAMPGDIKTSAANTEGYNFNYTLSGPEETAPVRIYDDGKSTYFQFKTPTAGAAMTFAKILPDGSEFPVLAHANADGKMVVDQVAGKFTIRDGTNLVCVFNEQQSAPVAAARP